MSSKIPVLREQLQNKFLPLKPASLDESGRALQGKSSSEIPDFSQDFLIDGYMAAI
jgi:hypothetical protein